MTAPTASLRQAELLGVVLAPPLSSYRRLPFRGEDIRAVLRSEACACGETAVQLSGELVEDAVRRHNAGTAHLLWRTLALAAYDAEVGVGDTHHMTRPGSRLLRSQPGRVISQE